MPEEKILTSETGSVEDMTPDYLEAIKSLKENSVDRSKYDELRAENKKLLQAVVNGQTLEAEVVKPEVNIQELRNKLFNNSEQTNLEYISNALVHSSPSILITTS